MKTEVMRSLFLIASLVVFTKNQVSAQYDVECFRLDGMNDTETIQAALDCIGEKEHGKIEFEGTKTYIINESLELPRYGAGIIILEGNGCVLKAKKDVNIFNRIPENQKEALNKMMNQRFFIQNFSFQGGDKAINIGATFGSKITDCSFFSQKEAAVDVQFGLMTTIENCMTFTCSKDNFVIRCGRDWGGNGYDSQSNHSSIRKCRVFAGKNSESAFRIIGSNGVTLEDVISEGHSEIKYVIFVSNKRSITQSFSVKNLHIEHKPTEAAILLDFDGDVNIEEVFYQSAYENFPLIKSTQNNATNNIRNIRIFVKGTIIQNQGHLHGIRWNLEDCHKSYFDKDNWKRKNKDDEWKEGFPISHFKKGNNY